MRFLRLAPLVIAKPLLLAIVSCFAALTAPDAYASLQWKWRDADGRLQYSDRPPPAGVPDKNILTRPAAAIRIAAAAKASEAAPVGASAPRLASKASDPELEARRRKADAEQAAQQKVEEEKIAKSRAEACQRARNYEKTLNDGIRIARTNNKGEREILDDKGRAEEQALNRETLAANCK